MNQNEVEPNNEPVDELVSEEQAFGRIGMPLDLLRNLSPQGTRIENPLTKPGINFFLGNAYLDGRLELPEIWEMALESEEEIPLGFWKNLYEDPEGKQVLEEHVQDEFPYLLSGLGINVSISFLEEGGEGDARQSLIEVKPILPQESTQG